MITEKADEPIHTKQLSQESQEQTIKGIHSYQEIIKTTSLNQLHKIYDNFQHFIDSENTNGVDDISSDNSSAPLIDSEGQHQINVISYDECNVLDNPNIIVEKNDEETKVENGLNR